MKCGWTSGKKILKVRTIQHWNRFPWEVVNSCWRNWKKGWIAICQACYNSDSLSSTPKLWYRSRFLMAIWGKQILHSSENTNIIVKMNINPERQSYAFKFYHTVIFPDASIWLSLHTVAFCEVWKDGGADINSRAKRIEWFLLKNMISTKNTLTFYTSNFPSSCRMCTLIKSTSPT